MIEAGILTEDDPVELLEGWLIVKMPKKPAHRTATYLVRTAIAALLPPGWYVDSQEPITTEDSEPEPDVVVVQGMIRDYQDCHPGPDAIALVIEVSDATLERDRTSKKRVYAKAGIAIYWIVNLVDRHIEVYRNPMPLSQTWDYTQQQNYQPTDQIPLELASKTVTHLPVQTLLP
jgi:hypothetical protein